MHVGGLLVTARQDAADVVELVERRGRRLQVAGQPVGLAQLRHRRDDGRELCEGTQQVALALVRQQRRVEACPDRRSAGANPWSAPLRRIEQSRAWAYCT